LSETKIVKCNKCQKEGLHWGQKTVKDKVYNILLEQDGSEHRPYADGKAECKKGAAKPEDKSQTKLDETSSIMQGIGQLAIKLDEIKTVVDLIRSEQLKK